MSVQLIECRAVDVFRLSGGLGSAGMQSEPGFVVNREESIRSPIERIIPGRLFSFLNGQYAAAVGGMILMALA